MHFVIPKNILFLSILTLLSSCGGPRTLFGELRIAEEFALTDDQGNDYTFRQGNPPVTLEVSPEVVNLKVRNRIFPFRIPKGVHIPIDDNGDFYISAADSGQSYDLNGSAFHTYQERLNYSSYEFCEKRDLFTGTRRISFQPVYHYTGTSVTRYRIEVIDPSQFDPLATLGIERIKVWDWKEQECDFFAFP